MGLGCICYQVYSILYSKCTNTGALYSSILELLCFSYIVYVLFWTGESPKDFVCIFVMAVLITSLFIGNSLWSKLLNNRLSQYLGSISIGIYLDHIILSKINWYEICSSHADLSWHASFLIYLLVVMAFSSISTQFVKNVLRA